MTHTNTVGTYPTHTETIATQKLVDAGVQFPKISVGMIFSLLSIGNDKIVDRLPQGFSISDGAVWAPDGSGLTYSDIIFLEDMYAHIDEAEDY